MNLTRPRLAGVLIIGVAACSNGSGSSVLQIQPQARVTPASSSSPITHVLTADYLGGTHGTHSIKWSQAAPYLTWAETNASDATAIHDAGIKTLDYVAPNRTEPGGINPFYNKNGATFAHTCAGDRIWDQWDGMTEWVMNPGSRAMRKLFARYVSWLTTQGHFDALFEDEDGALTAFERYGRFNPSLPCDYENSSWIKEEAGMNQAPSLPIIFNGLSGLNGDGPSLSIGLLDASNTIGGNYEGCYDNVKQPKEDGWLWRDVENTELQVAAKNKIFECMLRNSGQAANEIDARIYAYASFMLTYNPATSVYWTYFATSSRLHVMPESELVALSPTAPAPLTVTGLKQSGGTYARQYQECYIWGVAVGACAAVVNSDTGASHPFPFTQYNHTLVLSGAGVLDGGTISTDGPAPPSSVGPVEAVIAFP
jgi:hypothetical protein